MKLFPGERECNELKSTSYLHWFIKGFFVESVNFKCSKANFLKEKKVRKNSGSIALSKKLLGLIKYFATQFYGIEKNIKISSNKLQV